MSQPRQFEGPDIRALLDEVRTTFGEREATITRAETFRTGGVLGFFQRECYRLVVDVDEAAAGGSAAVERSAPVAVGVSARSGGVVSAPVGAGVSDPVGAGVSDPAGGVDPWAALADGTEDLILVGGGAREEAGTGGAAVGESPVQTATFEEVLRRVAAMVEAPEPTAAAEPAPPEPVAARAVTYGPVGAPNTPLAADAATATPPAAATALAAPAARAVTYAPCNAPNTPLAMAPVGYLRFPDQPPLQTRETSAPAPGSSPLAAPAPAPAHTPAATSARTPARLGPALRRAGLDRSMAADIEASVLAGRGLATALVQALSSCTPARPLPRRPGSLIAVVGPPCRAHREAARIAGEVASDPTAIGLAATTADPAADASSQHLRILTAEHAAEVAPGLRRNRVGVVAVEVPPGSEAWACHVLDALRPTMVLTIVDAMHKTEDLEAWLEAIGGSDALVVDSAERTTSPASVLALDVPVARLAGADATPARWAAVIEGRLALRDDATRNDADATLNNATRNVPTRNDATRNDATREDGPPWR